MVIKNYRQKKKSGLIDVVRINDAPAIGIKKFCPETGEPSRELHGVSINDIDAQIEQTKEMLAELEAFKADCESVMQ